MLGAAYLQASIEEHGFNYFEGFDSVPSKQAFYNTVDRSIDIAIQTQGIVSDEYDFRSQEETTDKPTRNMQFLKLMLRTFPARMKRILICKRKKYGQ